MFIDKTMFMGERGRWRAWKVDREGRQRENGLIPSATLMESQYKAKKQKVSRIIYIISTSSAAAHRLASFHKDLNTN